MIHDPINRHIRMNHCGQCGQEWVYQHYCTSYAQGPGAHFPIAPTEADVRRWIREELAKHQQEQHSK